MMKMSNTNVTRNLLEAPSAMMSTYGLNFVPSFSAIKKNILVVIVVVIISANAVSLIY